MPSSCHGVVFAPGNGKCHEMLSLRIVGRTGLQGLGHAGEPVQPVDVVENVIGANTEDRDLRASHMRQLKHRKLAVPIRRCEGESVGETLYSSSFQPDPRSARDVLAFVLTPVEAFASRNPDELEAVAELLDAAKAEAIERWYSLRSESVQS